MRYRLHHLGVLFEQWLDRRIGKSTESRLTRCYHIDCDTKYPSTSWLVIKVSFFTQSKRTIECRVRTTRRWSWSRWDRISKTSWRAHSPSKCRIDIIKKSVSKQPITYRNRGSSCTYSCPWKSITDRSRWVTRWGHIRDSICNIGISSCGIRSNIVCTTHNWEEWSNRITPQETCYRLGTRIFGACVWIFLFEYNRVDSRDIREEIVVWVRRISIEIESDIADRFERILILMSPLIELIIFLDEALSETTLTLCCECDLLGSRQRYEDSGIASTESLETPRIDRLTREPARTTAECPVCALFSDTFQEDTLSESISRVIDPRVEVKSQIGTDDPRILSSMNKKRH